MFVRTRAIHGVLRRTYSQTKVGGGSQASTPSSAASSPAPNVSSVTGLSSTCVKSVTTPVGPGAAPNAEYKVPEYFCFNRFSYHHAEVEMAKYRCPQPSAVIKK